MNASMFIPKGCLRYTPESVELMLKAVLEVAPNLKGTQEFAQAHDSLGDKLNNPKDFCTIIINFAVTGEAGRRMGLYPKLKGRYVWDAEREGLETRILFMTPEGEVILKEYYDWGIQWTEFHFKEGVVEKRIPELRYFISLSLIDSI